MATVKINNENDGYGYEYPKMQSIQSHSLRGLVDRVNDIGITKDDIVDIIKENEVYYLLYYI